MDIQTIKQTLNKRMSKVAFPSDAQSTLQIDALWEIIEDLVVKLNGRELTDTKDTQRLDFMEAVLWSRLSGNGLAIFPTMDADDSTSKQVMLQDLGSEDGSNLGDELTASCHSLREAIDSMIEMSFVANTQKEYK